ncbi:MAG: L,D-transpeptidase family protein [Rhodospirillales bacterium]|nr:L,D-transpeptidase family protein [Rhodospirillales bacterium]
MPGEGTEIVLPKARILPDGSRNGMLLNLPEQRLYFFRKGTLVKSYPLGVFRDGFSTPIGSTTVVRKKVNPSWYPTESARRDDPTLPAVVTPGPDNPLGSRAMYLGWPMYLIHGTNRPYGVGRSVSRGCIRMLPEHVEELFEKVPVGTPVQTVSQPVKVGWWNGELYIQAHPDTEQGLALEENGKIEPIVVPNVRPKIEAKAGEFADRVEWETVELALKERRGIPVRITTKQPSIAAADEATEKPLVESVTAPAAQQTQQAASDSAAGPRAVASRSISVPTASAAIQPKAE